MRAISCFVVAFASLALPAFAEECRTSDIQVISYNVVFKKGYAAIVGEIKNNCALPAGAELAVAWRNAAGAVQEVEAFWPASISNIQPGASFPFSHSVGATLDPSFNHEIAVRTVKRWRAP